MTRDEILAMKPGVKLDSLIELNVFNYTRSMYLSPRPFSTDISAAWEVLIKIKGFQLTRKATTDEFCVRRNYTGKSGHTEWETVYAATAPEAISKAALLAVMGQEAS